MTKVKIRCETTRVFYGGLIRCKWDSGHSGAHSYHVRVSPSGAVRDHTERAPRRPNPTQTLIRWR